MTNDVDTDYLTELFKASRQAPSEDIPEDIDRSAFIPSEQEPEIENKEELKQYLDSLEETQQEKPYETLIRQTASHAERAAEGLGGFWGDMQQFLSTLTGTDLEEKEIKSKEELSGFRFPGVDDLEGSNFSVKLPQTRELRDLSKEQFGQYLEPKTESDKATQEVAQDIGAMFASPGGFSFFQKMLFPVVGQTTKQIAKSLGASEKSQDITKIVSMMGASLFHLGNAQKVAGQAMNEAENIMPQGTLISAKPTEKAFQDLRNSTWYKSGVTLSKKPAIAEIKKIEKKISNGQLDGKMAMQLRKDLNETRRNMGGFEIVKREDKKQALRYLNMVDDALLESMENYGKNVNPHWWDKYNLARQAFSVTKRSIALSEFIHDNAGKKLISESGKLLFYPAVAMGMGHAPLTTMAAGAGYGAMKSYQIANRVMKSKVLRDHYMHVVLKATKGNSKQLQESIEKFDKVAAKIEGQSKKSPKKKPVMTR